MYAFNKRSSRHRTCLIRRLYLFHAMMIYFLPQLKTTFSTDSRVQNMFDILLSDEADKDKKEKVGDAILRPLCFPLDDFLEL